MRPDDPGLFAAVRGRRAPEVTVLGDDLEARQLEEVAHLPAVGPSEREGLADRSKHPAGCVDLGRLPRFREDLPNRIVDTLEPRDSNIVPGSRMLDDVRVAGGWPEVRKA
jgi:hypothetical protein